VQPIAATLWESADRAGGKIRWRGWGPKFDTVPFLLGDTSSTIWRDGAIVEAWWLSLTSDSVNGSIEKRPRASSCVPLKACRQVRTPHGSHCGRLLAEQTDKYSNMLALAAGELSVFVNYFVGQLQKNRIALFLNAQLTFLNLAPRHPLEGQFQEGRSISSSVLISRLNIFGAT